ncbi:MAG: type 4a pilus biogenesis protein PilO [Desulfuromonadales bacterium]|jgi:Tfp pilus assembly protein PilO
MRWEKMAGQLWGSHRRSVILLGVLLILNLLLFAVIEQFVTPRVAEQKSHFLQRQAEVRQLLRNRGGATNTPEQAYFMAVEDLSKFHQMIPDYQEFTGLIEELLVLSSRAGLNINRVAYNSSPLKESGLLKLDLQFNVVGDYDQIKTFIHSLEQSARLIVINQIGLQGADDEGVNLRLNLETYFRAGGREA